jgi:FtsP/CotA-like multicopper oxidase with cupredoxin domain
MSSYVSKHRGEPESLGYKDALLGVVSLLLGLLVAILGFVVLMMWLDARDARDDANQAKVSTTDSMAGMPGMTASLGALTSFAGAAPANADALAAAHKPFPATLPGVPAGPVANVKLALTDINVEIAPGVRYSAWAWAGGAPGPVIHVRQGQLVKITLTNNGAIPHSVDFHAARIAPDKAFGDVFPGKSVSYSFRANDPGVFIGTILNTAYAFGDMNPADALHNVQTVTVPAGGGGVFDVKIDQPGLYPFVSHAFAAVDQGQVGLLNVGDVKGTMSH